MAKPTNVRAMLSGGDTPPPQLGWEGRDLLQLLRDMGARPGVPIGIHRPLWFAWLKAYAASGNEAFGRALDQLSGAALVEPLTADSTDVVLTEADHRTF